MAIRSHPGIQDYPANLISSELCSHQMAIRGHPGVQELPASQIPSVLSSHQMAVRGHPRVFQFAHIIATHFGIFGPTVYVRTGPVQARVPIGAAPTSYSSTSLLLLLMRG